VNDKEVKKMRVTMTVGQELCSGDGGGTKTGKLEGGAKEEAILDPVVEQPYLDLILILAKPLPNNV
jgi:hypothetical protein